MVLNWRQFGSPGDICQCLEMFLIGTTGVGGRARADVSWVEGRDAAKNPTMHRMASTMKN